MRLPHSRRPKQSDAMEEPVVPLERNFYAHLSAGLLQEIRLQDVLWSNIDESTFTRECLNVYRKSQLLFFVFVDDIEHWRQRKFGKLYVKHSSERQRIIDSSSPFFWIKLFGLHWRRSRSWSWSYSSKSKSLSTNDHHHCVKLLVRGWNRKTWSSLVWTVYMTARGKLVPKG